MEAVQRVQKMGFSKGFSSSYVWVRLVRHDKQSSDTGLTRHWWSETWLSHRLKNVKIVNRYELFHLFLQVQLKPGKSTFMRTSCAFEIGLWTANGYILVLFFCQETTLSFPSKSSRWVIYSNLDEKKEACSVPTSFCSWQNAVVMVSDRQKLTLSRFSCFLCVSALKIGLLTLKGWASRDQNTKPPADGVGLSTCAYKYNGPPRLVPNQMRKAGGHLRTLVFLSASVFSPKPLIHCM